MAAAVTKVAAASAGLSGVAAVWAETTVLFAGVVELTAVALRAAGFAGGLLAGVVGAGGVGLAGCGFGWEFGWDFGWRGGFDFGMGSSVVS